jgi:hypothetical protein
MDKVALLKLLEDPEIQEQLCSIVLRQPPRRLRYQDVDRTVSTFHAEEKSG